jgi:pyruvate,water dikinase
MRQVERIEKLVNPEQKEERNHVRINKFLESNNAAVMTRYKNHFIISHTDCGFALSSLIGWKAANLAETEHLCDADCIPPWFVITDSAFRQVMCSKINVSLKEFNFFEKHGTSLQNSIDKIIERKDISNQQKARTIQILWDQIELDHEIQQQVISEFRKISIDTSHADTARNFPTKVYVALRSSSREEDTESAARAGEFETYLYIGDEERLIRYLKRTWSGLWTERAIHNRQIFGNGAGQTGGGVIVQRKE